MTRRLLLCALCLLLWPFAGAAEEGGFDYYLLSLSWSPSYCGTRAGQGDEQQCGLKPPAGFVVHGLWPQFQDGSYPSQCSTERRLDRSAMDVARSVMPTERLAVHEWKRHGTCSGLSAKEYFETTALVRRKLVIPAPLVAPTQPLALSLSQMESLFQQANPGLKGDIMAVQCRGAYLAEIRFCLDRSLNFRSCGEKVQDRCAGTIQVPVARPGAASR